MGVNINNIDSNCIYQGHYNSTGYSGNFPVGIPGGIYVTIITLKYGSWRRQFFITHYTPEGIYTRCYSDRGGISWTNWYTLNII